MRDFETGLTAAKVRELFRYVKSRGQFIRRVPVLGGKGGIQDDVGSIAGCLHSDGYVYIAIKGRLYLAHRLAWLWVQGRWPKAEIDHRNRDRSDNRWCNLREATSSQNRSNRLTLGVTVKKTKSGNRYIAQIKKDKRHYYLGCFTCKKQAMRARMRAERELFGAYAARR